MAEREQLAARGRVAVEPVLRQQRVDEDDGRIRRGRARRRPARLGSPRTCQATTTSATRSSASFQAATTSSARPADARGPRAGPSRRCAARARRRAPRARRRMQALSRQWRPGSGRGSRCGRGPGRATRELRRDEQVDLLRPVLPERARTPRAQVASGSQWTSGSRVCTSSGNRRFGVVMKTRRPTRSASRDEAALPLAAADVLDDGVREDDVELAVGERQRERVALHVPISGIALAEAARRRGARAR